MSMDIEILYQLLKFGQAGNHEKYDYNNDNTVNLNKKI